MRHSNKNKKFGRKKDERQALFKSLAISLIERGKIQTSESKARALRPMIEKMVTRARRNDFGSQRLLVSRLGANAPVQKLMREIAPRYTKRPGGYTRITKLPPRLSDSSRLAIIEFV